VHALRSTVVFMSHDFPILLSSLLDFIEPFLREVPADLPHKVNRAFIGRRNRRAKVSARSFFPHLRKAEIRHAEKMVRYSRGKVNLSHLGPSDLIFCLRKMEGFKLFLKKQERMRILLYVILELAAYRRVEERRFKKYIMPHVGCGHM